MVKNGLHAVMMRSCNELDEDGKILKGWNPSESHDSEIVIYVKESPIIANLEISSIIVDIYEFSAIYNCTFETADGITQDSDEDDLKKLEGYVTCRGIVSPGSEACTALYVDGKLVDLEEYRDEYEAWLKVAEEEGIRSANEGEGLKGMYNHYYRDKNWNQMKFRREN